MKNIVRFFLISVIFGLQGCIFPDNNSYSSSSSESDSKYGKGLNPYVVPKDCELRKMFVFKVVCDQGANIFGIDHSFVEAICESELDLLEGMPVDKAFNFLRNRAEFFKQNTSDFHEYSRNTVFRNMNGVTITPIIKSNFSDQTTCILNNGSEEITVNAEVYPYCNNGEDIYNHARCGVRISNIRVANNGSIIQSIKMPEDTISPSVGYQFDSGFIYKNFGPAKGHSVFSSGYYSDNPDEQDIYMKKDTAQFLDKYR